MMPANIAVLTVLDCTASWNIYIISANFITSSLFQFNGRLKNGWSLRTHVRIQVCDFGRFRFWSILPILPLLPIPELTLMGSSNGDPGGPRPILCTFWQVGAALRLFHPLPSLIQVFQLFPLLDSSFSTFSPPWFKFFNLFGLLDLPFPPRPSTARQPPSKQVRGQAAQAMVAHFLHLCVLATPPCPAQKMNVALPIANIKTHDTCTCPALESIFGVLFWFWLIGYNLDPRRACPLFPSFLSSATPHPSINPHIFNARPSQQLAESFRETEEAPRPTCLHHTPTAFK